MIEQLTPGVLASSTLLLLLLAPLLTALLAALLLWRYRRAVIATMSTRSGAAMLAGASPQADNPPKATPPIPASQLWTHARGAPLRDLLAVSAAMVVAAVPLSIAAQQVYPSGTGAAGFAIGLWLYAWPLVPAAALIMPLGRGWWVTVPVCWTLVYALLALWGSSYLTVPEQHLGGFTLEARSAITPQTMGMLWLSVNGVPTALYLLCFNRWVRAVAPLVLLLVTLLLAGLWSAWLWASMPVGFELLVSLAETLPLPPPAIVAGYALMALALLLVLGWALVRTVGRAYGARRVSDRSLALDAVYLAFIASYGQWLVLGGLGWLLCVPLAFVLYRLSLRLTGRLRPAVPAPRSLCLLRVFSLGRRSERLGEAVARYWRGIGSIQLITGPDVATSVVQPQQFLDFLSGELQRHFVRDAPSLELALRGLEQDADPDGRYRLNALFCYADTWQSVLPAITGTGALLMDLRGFSEGNAGCREELRFIAARVPAGRCVLLTGADTDSDFLQRELEQALSDAPSDGPNTRAETQAFRQMDFRSGDAGVRELVQGLLQT